MQYEIIRKSLLADPSSGGLIRLVADKPAYLPSSGSDYVFSPLDYWRGCLFTRAELVLASLFDALEANARPPAQLLMIGRRKLTRLVRSQFRIA